MGWLVSQSCCVWIRGFGGEWVDVWEGAFFEFIFLKPLLKFFCGSTRYSYVNDWFTAFTLGGVGVSKSSDWGFFRRVCGVITSDSSGIIHVFCDESAGSRIIAVAELVELDALAIFDDSASESALFVTGVCGSGADDFFTILFFYEGAFLKCGIVEVSFELSGGSIGVFHQADVGICVTDFLLRAGNSCAGEQGERADGDDGFEARTDDFHG